MEKKYAIKEIYYTIQGEGFHAGKAAVFCRFSGCNLWSGREEDRSSAICKFCDTNFWGTDGINGGKYNVGELTERILSLFSLEQKKMIVFTGGEPGLQVDEDLVARLKKEGIYTTIETNGTIELPSNLDWITFSPKANSKTVIKKANEIKIVYPQLGINPLDYNDGDFDHFYIQPLKDKQWTENTAASVHFCKKNPRWSLSVQLHKYLNIP